VDLAEAGHRRRPSRRRCATCGSPEGLYDRKFVETRTTGFDEWKAYILGETDGIPKTPEWQEKETGVPARDVRALAREWGTKKTYLGVGGWGVGLGGAGRGPMGIQWARMMTILGAMQGFGRPGSNFGNLQFGTPLDFNFYFPGYAEGSFSGDLVYSANSANNYQRMPHILTMSSVRQAIPRMWLPEAITEGKAMGYLTDVASVQGQFFPFGYPSPGHVRVEMLYKYGSSSLRHAGQCEPLGAQVPAREPEVRRQPVGVVGGRDALSPT
jgi:anaerobic selenocysteine-containing dehydrogenase